MLNFARPALPFIPLSKPTSGPPDYNPLHPFNRCESKRKDDKWLGAMASRADAKILLFSDDRVAVQPSREAVFWAPGPIDANVMGKDAFFLGMDKDELPYFVRSYRRRDAPTSLPLKWEALRSAMGRLSPFEISLVVQGRSFCEWHRGAAFCGACGSETRCMHGGLHRTCAKCDKSTWPRTDPVAIMAVVSPCGDKILLGQSKGRMQKVNMFSVLAGFVDQGECLEDAVRREVKEEAGIDVGEVQYLCSQPWPMPHQLMLGCMARAKHVQIEMDPEEMSDVKWFSREEVALALKQQAGDAPVGEGEMLFLPNHSAIAHHLIRAWLDGAHQRSHL